MFNGSVCVYGRQLYSASSLEKLIRLGVFYLINMLSISTKYRELINSVRITRAVYDNRGLADRWKEIETCLIINYFYSL